MCYKDALKYAHFFRFNFIFNLKRNFQIMVKKLGQECNFFIIYIYCEYYNYAG